MGWLDLLGRHLALICSALRPKTPQRCWIIATICCGLLELLLLWLALFASTVRRHAACYIVHSALHDVVWVYDKSCHGRPRPLCPTLPDQQCRAGLALGADGSGVCEVLYCRPTLGRRFWGHMLS